MKFTHKYLMICILSLPLIIIPTSRLLACGWREQGCADDEKPNSLTCQCEKVPKEALGNISRKSCNEAIESLEKFLSGTENKCETSDDCVATYVQMGGCKPPKVMSKTTMADAEFIKTLTAFQTDVRNSCEEEWKKHPSPACAPIPVSVECYEGICTDSNSRQD